MYLQVQLVEKKYQTFKGDTSIGEGDYWMRTALAEGNL